MFENLEKEILKMQDCQHNPGFFFCHNLIIAALYHAGKRAEQP
jgi:hypothetical protein